MKKVSLCYRPIAAGEPTALVGSGVELLISCGGIPFKKVAELTRTAALKNYINAFAAWATNHGRGIFPPLSEYEGSCGMSDRTIRAHYLDAFFRREPLIAGGLLSRLEKASAFRFDHAFFSSHILLTVFDQAGFVVAPVFTPDASMQPMRRLVNQFLAVSPSLAKDIKVGEISRGWYQSRGSLRVGDEKFPNGPRADS